LEKQKQIWGGGENRKKGNWTDNQGSSRNEGDAPVAKPLSLDAESPLTAPKKRKVWEVH